MQSLYIVSGIIQQALNTLQNISTFHTDKLLLLDDYF